MSTSQLCSRENSFCPSCEVVWSSLDRTLAYSGYEDSIRLSPDSNKEDAEERGTTTGALAYIRVESRTKKKTHC